MGAWGIQGKWVQKSSMAVNSIFSERKVKINQYWKEEGFGYQYHTLLMCEMMDPYKYRLVRLACVGSLKGKYERYNHKSENEDQMVGLNPN